MKLVNIVGWIGTSLIIIAYALVSFKVLNTGDILYQLFNLFGAFGIVISSYYKNDIQPVILNLFWGLIALFALISLIK